MNGGVGPNKIYTRTQSGLGMTVVAHTHVLLVPLGKCTYDLRMIPTVSVWDYPS